MQRLQASPPRLASAAAHARHASQVGLGRQRQGPHHGLGILKHITVVAETRRDGERACRYNYFARTLQRGCGTATHRPTPSKKQPMS
jgi:hypothetical protein